MRNILLKSLHRITRDQQTLGRFKLDLSKYLLYEQMHQISTESFENNLVGDWELIYLNKQFESVQDSFIYTMLQTHDIWKSEPCNILYADPDTLCFAPTRVFGKDFLSCCLGNCGVRYFPHNMDPALWDLSLTAIDQWEYDNWNYEQDVYNRMYTERSSDDNHYITDIVKNAPIDSYKYLLHYGESELRSFFRTQLRLGKSMMHLHSSRHIDNTLLLMQKTNNLINTA